MDWFLWFGQTLAFVVGAFSLLLIIGIGALLVLKLMVRKEYNNGGEGLDLRY
jgi:hypothetical protein